MKQFIIIEGDRRNLQAGKIRLVKRHESGVIVRVLATIALIAVVALTVVPYFLAK